MNIGNFPTFAMAEHSRARIWPGRPTPLGATWDGKGVNFAIFSSQADKIELCLFDPAGRREIERIELPEHTDEVWHGYLPTATPGTLYGYRVYGPYDPRNGHRFNPHKLLLDPYAKAIVGRTLHADAVFGYRIGSSRADLSFDRRDSARAVPKCRVVDPSHGWGGERKPRTPWAETIIYETHVRGFTIRHPALPAPLRGTFGGLAAPIMIDYLKSLGITTVELLPIHAFLDDRHLAAKGLRNYWGYNSIGFFAPEPRYLAQGDIAEFKIMVARLHDAGIEVILDVVFNHTAEGNHLGPTLNFRGIDNAAYYRLQPQDKRYYVDDTGTGNTLNLDHPRVVQMVLDSLHYWVNEMHVDGFRFDLATTVGRRAAGFDPASSFFCGVLQSPTLQHVKLIAEPWDVGPGGYQLGNFPPGWAEWNDRYRDTVRRFWRGDEGVLPELAARLTGSADLFDRRGRKPWASVNFVTAHDGFTLQDLVSYNTKHNEANLEDGQDGHSENYSFDYGAEGATDDPTIVALRDRQKRSFLATLLGSQGTPMLLAGDESGRTQRGNNNAYCQDNEISWHDWEAAQSPAARALSEFLRQLIGLRRAHPVLRRRSYLHSRERSADGLADITWYAPQGTVMTPEQWQDPKARCIGVVLNGRAGPDMSADGVTLLDDVQLILMNAHHEEVPFVLPALPGGKGWRRVIDTSQPDLAGNPKIQAKGETYPLAGRCYVEFTMVSDDAPA